MTTPTWSAESTSSKKESSSTKSSSTSSEVWTSSKPATSSWATTSSWYDVPTPYITTCASTGVYTVPDKTITVTTTDTIVVKTSTPLTPGWNTYGGYVTTVTDKTTVTVPCETTMSKSSTAWDDKTTTEVLTSTVYECPSAGVWTVIPPVTTSVSTSTVVVYPVPWTMTPGTYTRTATTVTATVTDQVIYCPYEGVWSTVPASTPTATVWATPATYTEAWTEPATQAWTSSAPAATPSKAVGGGAPVVNGNKWAITYTPYTSSGDCKSAGDVMSDLASIKAKGFTTVRLYATDCSGLENVGAACEANGLKIILGVFIEGSGIGGAAQQVSDIAAWGSAGHWSTVTMIVVGNEAIFNGFCSAEELAGFISSSKATWAASGYSGAVTTTEPLNILQASGSALCGVMDVVAANIQPFFNSGITADQAGDFVASQLWAVGQVCPGLTAYNLECGWPTAGSPNGMAVPGTSEQATAISSIMSQVGANTVFFSFANDYWKAEGSFGVEQSFGCSDLF